MHLAKTEATEPNPSLLENELYFFFFINMKRFQLSSRNKSRVGTDIAQM